MKSIGLAAGVAIAALLAGAASVPAAAQGLEPTAPSAEAGQRIAERLCASCHAMEAVSTTVPAGIPTLRAIANRAGQTGERITGILLQPHTPMPDLRLSLLEIRDLLGYLERLRKGGGQPLIDLNPGKDLPTQRRG